MPAHPPADLEDDRILIDIQTEMALQKMVMESALKTHKSPIPQFLKGAHPRSALFVGHASYLLRLAESYVVAPGARIHQSHSALNCQDEQKSKRFLNQIF